MPDLRTTVCRDSGSPKRACQEVHRPRPQPIPPKLSCASAKKHAPLLSNSVCNLQPGACCMRVLRSCFPGGGPTHPLPSMPPPGLRLGIPSEHQKHIPRATPIRGNLYLRYVLTGTCPRPPSGRTNSLRLLSGTAPSALACMLQTMPQSSVTRFTWDLTPYAVSSSLASLLPSRRKQFRPQARLDVTGRPPPPAPGAYKAATRPSHRSRILMSRHHSLSVDRSCA